MSQPEARAEGRSHPHCLIVTGPPGSGKTTVARLLADRRERAVHLESDAFFRFIRSSFIAPWRPEAHAQNSLVMGIVAEAAARYAGAGYFTVVDGIISPGWFFRPLRDALRDRGVSVGYVILRPSLATAIERAAGRPEAPLADRQAVAQIYEDFAEPGDLAGHVIDNETMTPEQTADDIEARLRRGELLV